MTNNPVALDPVVLEPFVLADEAATVSFGQRLGKAVRKGAVIFLRGDLGAGKTTLCRGVLQAFGHDGAVKSPTYTLVEPYQLAEVTLYHFDLYRLGDPEELEFMGIRDYFSDEAICLVEWPDKGEGCLPLADLELALKVADNGRLLLLTALSARGEKIATELVRNV